MNSVAMAMSFSSKSCHLVVDPKLINGENHFKSRNKSNFHYFEGGWICTELLKSEYTAKMYGDSRYPISLKIKEEMSLKVFNSVLDRILLYGKENYSRQKLEKLLKKSMNVDDWENCNISICPQSFGFKNVEDLLDKLQIKVGH